MFCIEKTGEKNFSAEFETLVKLRKNLEVKTIIGDATASDLIDDFGTSVLHLAAMYENVDLINFSLALGCDVNAKNTSSNTPLLLAAVYSRLEALKVLLDNKADVFSVNAAGRMALQIIINKTKEMPESIVKPCIEKLKERQFEAEVVADILVKANCRLDIVVMLINDLNVSRLFLSRVRSLDKYECLEAMEHVIKSVDLDHMDILLKYGPKTSIRMGRVVQELSNMVLGQPTNINCARIYIERIPSWNIYESSLIKFLHEVFRNGSPNVIEMFLQYDIDVHVKNNFDHDLTVNLFGNYHVNVLETLQGRQFNVNGRGAQGLSALHFAIINKTKYVEYLLESGADPNNIDNYGMTPIFYVTRVEDLELLLLYNADIQIIDETGSTCFHKVHDSLKDIIVAHLATIEEQGLSVECKILNEIRSSERLQNLYKELLVQLGHMKIQPDSKSLKLFKALVKRPENFCNLVKNEQTVSNYLNICRDLQLHRYYYETLEKKLKKALQIYNLRCTANSFIPECIGLADASYLITERIINFFTYKELLVLCNKYEESGEKNSSILPEKRKRKISAQASNVHESKRINAPMSD